MAVYLAYAAPAGHTLIDRRLYLPQPWCEDSTRRQTAGVPDDVKFATKPALAAEMITTAVDGGVPAGWVGGDEVYGADPELRAAIAARGLGYVLGIGSNRTVTTAAGRQRVDALAHALPRRACAAPLRRNRRQGTALNFLGADRHQRRAGWSSSAGAPQR